MESYDHIIQGERELIIVQHRKHQLDPFVFPEKFNSNNHPIEEHDKEAMEQSYLKEVNKTNLTKWMKIMDYRIDFDYTFTDEEARILHEAAETGFLSQRRFARYTEELETIQNRLNKHWVEGEWFCRLDSSSPKDGCKKFPLRSPEEVVDALSTSERAAKGFKRGERTLYFVQFDKTWDPDREIRCFVYKRKLTAISQYKWFACGYFGTLDASKLTQVAKAVTHFVEGDVVPKVCDLIRTDNIVVDLYIREVTESNVSIRFVECNSFGYWLASGSALFHWITDKEKLYNEEGKIYFKILTE